MPLGNLRALATAACQACGANPVMTASLVEASLAANWHGRPEIGMAHLLDYLDGLKQGRIDGNAEPEIDRPLPAIIRVDGKDGIAQTGFDAAFESLVDTARTFGIALFAQKNSYTAGELGYYPRRLAQRGLIGLAVSNSHAMVATGPHRQPAFGTNPMAFAAPRSGSLPPMVFDQAASATAFVNLARAAEAGTTIPADWAIDADGAPTTDPTRAVLGALLPFGGNKGANIALMIEILSGGLAGGSWSVDAGHFRTGSASPRSGLTVIAIAPNALDADFTQRLDAHLVRLATLGVYIPGQAMGAMPEDDTVRIRIERATLDALQTAVGTIEERPS